MKPSSRNWNRMALGLAGCRAGRALLRLTAFARARKHLCYYVRCTWHDLRPRKKERKPPPDDNDS